eukprot:TRINITY_DN156_c0_g1_i2.p1 TRINITY_DN156_c0_g1~~TRINITY_DN156_c0_g1_i2.p1  ORF type:complete len:365 (-),score=46.73 TRINITY_DN156_c0_g1_i2:47-1111(-)
MAFYPTRGSYTASSYATPVYGAPYTGLPTATSFRPLSSAPVVSSAPAVSGAPTVVRPAAPAAFPSAYPAPFVGGFPGAFPAPLAAYPGAFPGYPGAFPGYPGAYPGAYPGYGRRPTDAPADQRPSTGRTANDLNGDGVDDRLQRPYGYPGAYPGAFPGAYPGAFPGAYPGAYGAFPGAYPGAFGGYPGGLNRYSSYGYPGYGGYRSRYQPTANDVDGDGIDDRYQAPAAPAPAPAPAPAAPVVPSGRRNVIVDVVEARDLPASILDNCDPYVEVTIGGVTKSTTTKKNPGKIATWDERFEFSNVDINSQGTATVKDKDLGSDDHVGSATFDLVSSDRIYTLKPKGQLRLKINIL